jgi:uncharacterized membrane protein YfcA
MPERNASTLTTALLCGGAVGILGGLIGLGGAEFRLPLLIGLFGFAALEAVILNKAMSLMVVAAALVFRSHAIAWSEVAAHGSVILNLLGGSLVGAWVGAHWATLLRTATLYRVIAIMLAVIAAILLLGHGFHGDGAPLATGTTQLVLGLAAGFGIGVVASVMGVAGGELLIPTLILLFGVEVKLAGSLSLAVSLPTMLMGFIRYTQDRSFQVLAGNRTFVVVMAAGSILGALIGGRLVGIVPSGILLPLLAAILVLSAVKLWRHR